MLSNVLALYRRIQESNSSARYAWQSYQKAYSEKDASAAQEARERVIKHEAEVGAYMQALHIVTDGAKHLHMWDVEDRLGKPSGK